MRFLRLSPALLAFSVLISFVAISGSVARAQSTEEAEDAAEEAQRRASAASGLVDEAVANREELERQLADSIIRLNELTAELSAVGADIDRIASQVGYADVELAGIQSDIEHQAVNTYMTALASPSVSVVNTGTVEEAMVASSVMQDVVGDSRQNVGQLAAKRKDLIALQEEFQADQERYRELQEAVDEEVARYTALYEEADAGVAAAIREAESADKAYRAALSAVELAKAKDAERRRQESRNAANPTTTTTTPPDSTSPTTPSTDPPSPTTTAPPTTSTTSSDDGGGGPWDHPPEVERWRSLVQQFFPSNRVEEALRIIDCESNGDPNATNPYSGAGGLFQFLPSTWASASTQAGYAGYSVYDPEANIATAAWLANRYREMGYDYWHPWNCKRELD